jgi:hypothetical protein
MRVTILLVAHRTIESITLDCKACHLKDEFMHLFRLPAIQFDNINYLFNNKDKKE